MKEKKEKKEECFPINTYNTYKEKGDTRGQQPS